MKRFIETFRSFQSDDGKVRTTLEVEELTFDIGKFEDEALIVHYLPLVESTLPTADPFLPSKRRLTKSDEVNRLSLSYLVELKKRPSRIDAAKCLSLGVPKGPMIGHLQRGMTVTLADGRVIKPEDVWLTVDGEEPRQPAVLVVNCPTLSLLPSLVNASALQRYKNSEASDPTSPYLKYVVHYTNDQTLRSDEYVEWMASFGSDTTHLVVNGSGPILPHSDGVYRMQTQLNFLHADIFPNLASHGYSGMLPNAPVETSLGKVNVVVGEPFMSFPLRGRQPIEEDTIFDTIETNKKWDVNLCVEDHLTKFDKSEVVYLTSESENVIETLTEDKVYVIGGLIDHNSQKGLCHRLAVEKGVAHGRLPIDEYVQMKTRQVLTINQVFDILARFTESANWKDAFFSAIPKRKGVVEKDGVEKDDAEKDGAEKDGVEKALDHTDPSQTSREASTTNQPCPVVDPVGTASSIDPLPA
uniref:tRNA (guanine(9)-N(1))-methyltransferase n=1 Tax=Plectus sambesii TaxID=2011161 RepID=A0A914XTD3_9BILA